MLDAHSISAIAVRAACSTSLPGRSPASNNACSVHVSRLREMLGDLGHEAAVTRTADGGLRIDPGVAAAIDREVRAAA